MIKVITYGTFDLLHYGHIRLLQRARALGDYLIVGVTSADYDMSRGKTGVHQSLVERMRAVRDTGLADEIIVEEYEGQKIDDIINLDIDVFAIGSDWIGSFDYLSEYCKVVYLDRTEGISSSDLRAASSRMRLGLVGNVKYMDKYLLESRRVDGMETVGICADNSQQLPALLRGLPLVTDDYSELLAACDAVYIASAPALHYEQIHEALCCGVHVLCESPIALTVDQFDSLTNMARDNNLVLGDAIRPAYSTAFHRLMLMLRGGRLGSVVSVDATCTSLRKYRKVEKGTLKTEWSCFCEWAPIALYAAFSVFGATPTNTQIATRMAPGSTCFDEFSKINLLFETGVSTISLGVGVKSEGDLVIAGTKGYAYVPAPWWRTDYYEIRYEDSRKNTRHFYPFEGAGVRQELLAFSRAVVEDCPLDNVSQDVSRSIVQLIENYYNNINVNELYTI